MNWYLKALKHYADFSGRARRKEYWLFSLFNVIFGSLASIVDSFYMQGYGYGMFYILYALAVLIPGWAVSVRRLHDIGKSGWMFFIVLIPFVGAIWLIILMATDSQQGSNQWGENPKEVTE